MHVRLAILLTTVSLLAGCSGDETPADDGAGPGDGPDDGTKLQVPTWQIGDYWTYRTPGGEQTLVVTEDTGTAYVVDTTSRGTAFFHARQPISYLGEIRKADLAGSQDTGPVKFLDWPLEDGKTWSALWDGANLDLVAHDQGDEVFHIQALSGETVINQFQYNNATGWFDWISFGDDEGNEVFRMDLVDSGSGFSGIVERVTPEEAYAAEGNGPGTTIYGPLEADAGDAYLEARFACTTGPFLFAVGPVESVPSIATADPDSDGYSESGTCPVDSVVGTVLAEAPFEGTWGAATEGGPDFEYAYTVWIRHVEAIQVG